MKSSQEQIRKNKGEAKQLSGDLVQLLLQFCEQNEETARKVLKIFEGMHQPEKVLQEMVKEPEKSDEVIRKMLQTYDLRYGVEAKPVLKKRKMPNREGMMNQLPADIVLEIALYLPPREMTRLMSMRRSWNQARRQSKYKTQGYFKSLCSTIFKNMEPQLPNSCRFNHLRDYVLANPLQFTPNIRYYVQLNVRNYVWEMRPQDLAVNRAYFKTFGSYQQIFLMAPRVHFNGYYFLREKYVRPVEQQLNMVVPKYNVIYYYRYVRFLPDGTIFYTISNLKLRNPEIVQRLSVGNIYEQHPQTLIGEYMQSKQLLFMKVVKGNTIFSFDCQFRTADTPFDELVVRKFNLQIVDESYIVQNINKDKKEEQLFHYVNMKEILEENEGPTRASSL